MTSRLGFGGAVLRGGAGEKASDRLLAVAFEAGVHHFDVAPAYGLGQAEDVLGAFIASRRTALTVTTKVGIARPSAPGLASRVRSLARPLFALAPGLRERLGRGVYRMTASRARFAVDDVERSLIESLRRLKTDHVEILLLHEVTQADLTDELLAFLDACVCEGRVGRYGVGSQRTEIEALLAHPTLASVVQTQWSVGDAPLAPAAGGLLITHGSLRPLKRIGDWLRGDPRRLDRVSLAADRDLASDDSLADAMLAAALASNSEGIVLAASGKPERIARHAAIASDPAHLAAGGRFAKAVLSELALG